MKKFLLGLVALLTLSTPALAQTAQAPSHVNMETMTVGSINNGIIPVVYRNQPVMIQLFGCNIEWTTNETFYILATSESKYPLAVRKVVLDFAYGKANGDWDIAWGAVVEAKMVCGVNVAKK